MSENQEFLQKKYNLHKSPEVVKAARRARAHTGEKVAQDPSSQIQNYLDRLKNILNPPKRESRRGLDRQKRNVDMLKRALYEKYVIKPHEIPDGYFENQARLAREQGHGAIEITSQMRRELSEVIVADQKSTLNNWIDYLSSTDAPYPDWLKYFSIRSILDMGPYDKEKKTFTKRSKGTTKPFPDLNREALAYVLDAINKKYKRQNATPTALETEAKEQFEKLLQGENFAKLYAWAIEKVTPASKEQLIATDGQWIKYPEGSDHIPLVAALQGHGTGWCTAGESTAQIQLAAGDFYVYYSLDADSKPTIPRAAIRMEGSSIREIRGVAAEQNLDPYIAPVVQDKLQEFPDGAQYEKKANDMKALTSIERKIANKLELSSSELKFLYEIDSPIEGFGYQRDPRIKESRNGRNPIEDAPIVFECRPDQIARSKDEIRSDTKAYIGPLFPGIFDKLRHIEYIFTSFPEGKIERQTVAIGGKISKELQEELKNKGFEISQYAQFLMDSKDFITQARPSPLTTIKLTVKDLGFIANATTDQIYEKAKLLGLDLCPAEVGPHLRLYDTKQPDDNWYYIAMKQIADVNGRPGVFVLGRHAGGLWLDDSRARPTREWYPDLGFVFSFRKLEA